MRYQLLLLIFSCISVFTSARTWQADSLAGYEKTTIIRSDSNPTTVIRKRANCNCTSAILYVHGYNDYFFQKEMGDNFVDSCYNFYALDLHGYGRSIRKGQLPYQAREVSEYYEDIDSAMQVMRNDGITNVALMGHSLGGLITSSYMNFKPDAMVNVLILNSPFLEWNMSGFMKKIVLPGVASMGKLSPKLSFSQGDDTSYGESLLSAYHGEWDYNVEWKTLHPRKVTAGWIRMVSQAQKNLRKQASIKVPILLMYSSISVTGNKWTELHQKGDAVLNVDDIKNIGMTLGSNVTELKVYGGIHDLLLSSPDVRNTVYKSIFVWLALYWQQER
jgi:alpha-beta hydrolase superfamily lysophospholipase